MATKAELLKKISQNLTKKRLEEIWEDIQDEQLVDEAMKEKHKSLPIANLDRKYKLLK